MYNQYVRVAADPGYDVRTEDRQMLLWPLFVTGFLLDDFVADNAFFGAQAVVLSSASSKTALAMAFQLSKNRDCQVIGLTSSRNVSFVEGLGCYDRVVPYDRIDALPSDLPVVFVDMAGDGAVVSALHHHFGDGMKYSCVVGATHWDRSKREENLPGPEPAFFFAPAQVQKRTADWGPSGLQERMASAWKTFLGASEGWIRVERGRGTEAVERVYRDTLEGRARPEVGHVLSLHS